MIARNPHPPRKTARETYYAFVRGEITAEEASERAGEWYADFLKRQEARHAQLLRGDIGAEQSHLGRGIVFGLLFSLPFYAAGTAALIWAFS